jgi:hypothetical protein
MNNDEKSAGIQHTSLAMSSVAHLDLVVPEVTWWKNPGLRKLYVMMPIFFLGSTLTGYDGSLLNGLQTMNPWQQCEEMI